MDKDKDSGFHPPNTLPPKLSQSIASVSKAYEHSLTENQNLSDPGWIFKNVILATSKYNLSKYRVWGVQQPNGCWYEAIPDPPIAKEYWGNSSLSANEN